MSHTPGPWIVGAHFAQREGGRTYIPILRPGNDPVPLAVVHRDVDGYGRGEGEANARLFAAAPKLLDAAIKTVNENLHLADGDNCTLRHLKAAIAKATDADTSTVEPQK